jgi:hypothetical protein
MESADERTAALRSLWNYSVRCPRGGSDQYQAFTEKLASLCEFCRNTPGMQDGCVLVRVLMSCPVRREAVFVDDVKEVAHSRPSRLAQRLLPVTNV